VIQAPAIVAKGDDIEVICSANVENVNNTDVAILTLNVTNSVCTHVDMFAKYLDSLHA